jgi:hypothetical protein
MKPFVNVDIPMPQDMLDALSMFECYCVGTKTHEVTAQTVINYLSTCYSKELASKFKPEYLFNSQEI